VTAAVIDELEDAADWRQVVRLYRPDTDYYDVATLELGPNRLQLVLRLDAADTAAGMDESTAHRFSEALHLRINAALHVSHPRDLTATLHVLHGDAYTDLYLEGTRVRLGTVTTRQLAEWVQEGARKIREDLP
jgi:hypothetical protein